MEWDWIISAVIIIWILLAIAAKMTHQTLPELLGGIVEWIKDMFGEGKDNVEEAVEGITIYE